MTSCESTNSFAESCDRPAGHGGWHTRGKIGEARYAEWRPDYEPVKWQAAAGELDDPVLAVGDVVVLPGGRRETISAIVPIRHPVADLVVERFELHFEEDRGK